MADTESGHGDGKSDMDQEKKTLADISEEDKTRAEELKNKANEFFKGLYNR